MTKIYPKKTFFHPLFSRIMINFAIENELHLAAKGIMKQCEINL